jgi:DNA repair protein RecO (recombination protein O)
LRRIVTEALLVRSVPYGESDLIVQLLTAEDGRLSAIVRGGRRSQKRVGGAMEPFHTLRVELEDRGKELVTMKEARLARVRARIASSLESLDAAGAALRWARQLCPPRTREPAAWVTLNALLDALDEGSLRPPRVLLAEAALQLLADVGYGLDLQSCVACGRPRPPARPAFVDPARGGVVCSACGGARRLLDARLLEVARDPSGMTVDDANALLGLVEEAMGAHAGIEA